MHNGRENVTDASIVQMGPQKKMFREPKTGSNKWPTAHQGASRCINCVLLYRGCFCKNDMRTHAYTSLDQLVRNADQLVTTKKRIEGVHHGASASRASRRITIHPRYHLFYTLFPLNMQPDGPYHSCFLLPERGGLCEAWNRWTSRSSLRLILESRIEHVI